MTLKKGIKIFLELILLILQIIITFIILSLIIPFVIVKSIMEEFYIYSKIGVCNLQQSAFMRRLGRKKVDT
jgi:hypothetical protein